MDGRVPIHEFKELIRAKKEETNLTKLLVKLVIDMRKHPGNKTRYKKTLDLLIGPEGATKLKLKAPMYDRTKDRGHNL
jgi:hypothetical protein